MNSIVVAGIVFAFTFGGALIGMGLRTVLPDSHLSPESKDVVKMGTGLIATTAALVLGLLIASTKSSFDAQRVELQQLSTNLVLLDRGLAHYGPEAKDARDALHNSAAAMLDRIWSKLGSRSSGWDSATITTASGTFYDKVRELKPANDSQRWLHSQALQIATEVAKTRWLLNAQQGSSIPVPFLVVLVFWLTVLFTSFGLFSPRNATAITTLLLCALSVSSAILLIIDLDQPFAGMFQISSEPLRNALAHLGQ